MTESFRGESRGLGAMWRRYGFLGLFRLARDLLVTRWQVPGARIIRWPFAIRGMSHIRIGKGFTAGVGLRLDAFPGPTAGEASLCLRIGEGVEVNDDVHIGAIESVTIGDRVLIASRVFISDHNHGRYSGDGEHSDPAIPPSERPWQSSPVVIEDRVWLGEGVVVLPGVRIGAGSIVGALSVVTKDIPANSIAVGSPARVAKTWNAEQKRWLQVVKSQSEC